MAMAGKPTPAGRPPQPQGPKATDLKKAATVGGRKAVGKQEDVHQLRLMDNSYLQYRLLNARAEAAGKAKAAAAEVRDYYCMAPAVKGLDILFWLMERAN
jgi:hypothetical protein